MTNLTPEVKIVPLGAIIQELLVAGKNIVLGFNTEREYLNNPAYFGATIGRFANRISNSKFTLKSKTYHLAANNGVNSLHGGPKGWHTKVFEGPKLELHNGKESAVYTVFSGDGEEGYPAPIKASVRYTAYEEDGKFILEIEYEAEIVDEAGSKDETIVNLTNHSYFNIGSGPTIEGTQVTLPTTTYLVVDGGGIPTGEIGSYPELTPSQSFTLGAVTPDIDDCFIFESEKACPLDTRTCPLKLNAAFYHPETKIHLEVHSTEPAFQFYTGRFIDVQAREDGTPARGPRSGFCVEPSRWVNAANVEGWEKQVVLKKGEKYGSKIVYKTWTE